MLAIAGAILIAFLAFVVGKAVIETVREFF